MTEARSVKPRRGPPLRVGELRALPPDAVVYASIIMWEDPTPQVRLDGLARVRHFKNEEDEWWSIDSSGGANEFRLDPELKDTDPCIDSFPEGETRLFQAVLPRAKRLVSPLQSLFVESVCSKCKNPTVTVRYNPLVSLSVGDRVRRHDSVWEVRLILLPPKRSRGEPVKLALKRVCGWNEALVKGAHLLKM